MSAVSDELTVVRGPSALGGGWRRFFSLTWLIASTDFKLTWYGSVLGYLWTLVRPLMFFGVLYLVFAVLLTSFTRGIRDFPVLLLMNVVMVSFFQEATSGSIPSVVVRENLVRKMHFPRMVIPLATVSTSLMNFTLNILVVFVFMLIYGVHPRLTWLLFPVAVAPLIALTCGFALVLSALYVRYRDVSPIWGVINQALFYACPVFYTIERIAQRHATLTRWYLFNPLATVMQQARHWMIGGTAGVPAWMGGYLWLAAPLGIVVAVCAMGYWVFNRMAPRIAEEL